MQVHRSTGGGDVLLSFLGVVILTFGFKIFEQRKLMSRHAPEMFGAVLASSAFSLFGTAAASRFVGLRSGMKQFHSGFTARVTATLELK